MSNAWADPKMTPESSLIDRFLDKAFNQGDFNGMDEFLSPGLITRTRLWGTADSRVGLKQLVAHLRVAFPDLHCQMDGEVGEGNKHAAHWTLRGTHLGIFLGNRPTGRTVTVQGMIFARVVDNQIVENWILLDQMGLLQQLGIIPPTQTVELWKD